MRKKILYIIMIIAIILGIIMIITKDFNYSTLYSNHKRLEIVIDSEYNLEDIDRIANETIKDSCVVRKTTLFGTNISIDVKNITDEEITNLFSKLNEKYGKSYDIKDLKKEDILKELNVTDIANMSDDEINTLISQIQSTYGLDFNKEELQDTTTLVRLSDVSGVNAFDMLKGLIVPMLICLGLACVYFAIRFHKAYKNAWLIKPIKLIFEMLLTQVFIIAIIALARIPVSNYLPVLLIFVWLLQLLTETFKSELELKKIDVQENV